MTNYPLHYEVQVESQPGVEAPWSGQAGEPAHRLQVSIPREFHGSGEGFSPEELYALSLANCFVATFKVAAARAKLAYEHIAIRMRLTEERDEAGHPWMARAKFVVDIKGAQTPDEMKRLLDEVSGECFILNSVRTEKVFEFNVH